MKKKKKNQSCMVSGVKSFRSTFCFLYITWSLLECC